MKSFPAAIVKTKQEQRNFYFEPQVLVNLFIDCQEVAHNKTILPYLRPYLAFDPAVYIPLYSHSHSIIYLLLSTAAIFTVMHITVSYGCQLSISFNHNTAQSKGLLIVLFACW